MTSQDPPDFKERKLNPVEEFMAELAVQIGFEAASSFVVQTLKRFEASRPEDIGIGVWIEQAGKSFDLKDINFDIDITGL